MQTRRIGLTTLVLSLLTVLLPGSPAMAHGEMDEDHLEEFHLHLDDYEEEVEELIADIRAIEAARANGEAPEVDELIDHWEEVGVHAAIERKATVTYPAIWQALIGFQQAVQKDRGADAVAAAAQDLEAALWQGLGALRLAATYVED